MIVVFGSINIDLVFRAAELPREGETVLTDAFATVPGGKGANQAVAAALARGRTSCPVAMVGQVGEDAFAELALRQLRAVGVDIAAVGRSRRPTGCASITVDARGRNQITVASGANLDASQDAIGDDLLSPGTWIVLQNEVAEAENLALARRAAARGAKVILNAAPARPMASEQWRGLLHHLIVNEAEAGALAGSADLDALDALARDLGTGVIATLGADGALAVPPGGSPLAVDALPLDRVVDTTAAGDCFVGALACALSDGEALDAALRFASVAGGLACTRPGAQTSAPHRAEIAARLNEIAPARRLAG